MSIKNSFTSLCRNEKIKNDQIRLVTNFVSDNVKPTNRTKCYAHLYYCVLFSGFRGATDLIIAAKYFIKWK